jgi:hypothetical protein
VADSDAAEGTIFTSRAQPTFDVQTQREYAKPIHLVAALVHGVICRDGLKSFIAMDYA